MNLVLGCSFDAMILTQQLWLIRFRSFVFKYDFSVSVNEKYFYQKKIFGEEE